MRSSNKGLRCCECSQPLFGTSRISRDVRFLAAVRGIADVQRVIPVNGPHTAVAAVLCFRCRWPGNSGSPAAGVALSRKGAKSRTAGRKLRSTGTKVKSHVARSPESNAKQQEKLGYSHELEKKLQTREHELAAARKHLAEALEQQTAISERSCRSSAAHRRLWSRCWTPSP
jgi:hypothetical protein